MARLASRSLRAELVKRFADGAVHTLDEAVASCGHLIPPEIAVRRFCREKGRTAPIDEMVAKGRRWMISSAVRCLGAIPHGVVQQKKWQAFVLPPGTYGYVAGSRHGSARLNEDIVAEIRRRHAGGETMKSLAAEYGVSGSSVSQICRRIKWRHVA